MSDHKSVDYMDTGIVEMDGVEIPPSILKMYPEYIRLDDKIFSFLDDYFGNQKSLRAIGKTWKLNVSTVKKIKDAAIQTTIYTRYKNVVVSGVRGFADKEYHSKVFARLEKQYEDTMAEMDEISLQPGEKGDKAKLDYRKHLLSIINKMIDCSKQFAHLDPPKEEMSDIDKKITAMKDNLKKIEEGGQAH